MRSYFKKAVTKTAKTEKKKNKEAKVEGLPPVTGQPKGCTQFQVSVGYTVTALSQQTHSKTQSTQTIFSHIFESLSEGYFVPLMNLFTCL